MANFRYGTNHTLPDCWLHHFNRREITARKKSIDIENKHAPSTFISTKMVVIKKTEIGGLVLCLLISIFIPETIKNLITE